MLVRFISGIISAILVVAVFLSDKIVINIVVSVVGILTLIEAYRAIGLNKYRLLEILGFSLAVSLTFGEVTGVSYVALIITLYIFAIMSAFLIYHKMLRLEELSQMFFLTIYISYFYANIVFVRKMPNGEFLVWLILIGAFVTDTFAYLIGVTFGKHKLCPEISPKKTVEGAIAGVVGSVLGYLFFGLIMQNICQYHVNYLLLLPLGILASIAAQIGDLFASIIKRQHNLKDFGTLIPGHGGVFDRCDSLLFVAPVVFLYLSYFGNLIIWR